MHPIVSAKRWLSSMPTLGIMHCCVLEKNTKANIPTSNGTAQWLKHKLAFAKLPLSVQLLWAMYGWVRMKDT